MWEHSGAMSRKRIQRSLIAAGVIGLIAVAETGPFVVRDLLAAFLLFCALFGVLCGVVGRIVLGSFLLGEGSCVALTCSKPPYLRSVFVSHYSQLPVPSRAELARVRSLDQV